VEEIRFPYRRGYGKNASWLIITRERERERERENEPAKTINPRGQMIAPSAVISIYVGFRRRTIRVGTYYIIDIMIYRFVLFVDFAQMNSVFMRELYYLHNGIPGRPSEYPLSLSLSLSPSLYTYTTYTQMYTTYHRGN